MGYCFCNGDGDGDLQECEADGAYFCGDEWLDPTNPPPPLCRAGVCSPDACCQGTTTPTPTPATTSTTLSPTTTSTSPTSSATSSPTTSAKPTTPSTSPPPATTTPEPADCNTVCRSTDEVYIG